MATDHIPGDPDDEAGSAFVTLGGGRAAAGRPSDLSQGGRPAIDRAVIASLGARLDGVAHQLTERERAALEAALGLAAVDPELAALAALPAGEVLDDEELAIVEGLLARPAPSGRGLREDLFLIMKGTRRCNLRCTYCRSWSDEPDQTMTFEVLAKATHGALAAPGVRSVAFVWHGGETTLRSLSFYRQALWLQQRFRRAGQQVSNSIQTNGTNLSAEWLDFLARHRWSVGVSLDGPPEVHDRRRLDIAGRPTSERVLRGLESLRLQGIPHHVLMVVDEDVIAVGAARLVAYLEEIGVRRVGLLNVVPEGPAAVFPSDPYLDFAGYVEFLRDLFRLWWPAHRHRISFRELEDLARKVAGGRGAHCLFAGNCMGGFLTIEPMGEVSSCDKYQGDPGYRYGHLLETDLADIPSSPALRRTQAQTEREIAETRACPWFEVCQGGCPHDRYVRSRRGSRHDEGCCGMAPLLEDMARVLRRGSAASTPARSDAASRPTPERNRE